MVNADLQHYTLHSDAEPSDSRDFRWRLFRGQAMEVLATMPDNYFDCIWTDPPYLLSNGGITCHAGRMVSVDKEDWDKSRGWEKDLEFTEEWMTECHRVLKPTGTIWVSGTLHFHAVAVMALDTRFGVSRHNVDTFALDEFGRPYLISLKWQQVSGTAEQKIPFEVVCLADAMIRNEEFYKAYLVLGGEGWRFKQFYLEGGLDQFLVNADLVNIVSLERFVELANQGRL